MPRSILGRAAHLPQRLSYAAVRASLGEGGGHAWFESSATVTSWRAPEHALSDPTAHDPQEWLDARLA